MASRVQVPEGVFTEESDAEACRRIRFEPLIVRPLDVTGATKDPWMVTESVAFVLHDVLSKEECAIVKQMMDTEIDHELEHGQGRAEGVGNRECDRAIRSIPEISEHCYARVSPFLDKIVKEFRVDLVSEADGRAEYAQKFVDVEGIPDDLCIPASQQRPPVVLGYQDAQRVLLSDERSLDWDGTWKLHAMKERTSCLRYKSGDYFKVHSDDQQSGPGDTLFEPVKSLFTGLLYLNEDFTSGNTNFLSHEEGHPVLLGVNPGDPTLAGAPGSFLFFFQQGMLHEGEALQTDQKYVMRLDLFYKQVETTISPERRKGLELFQKAREQYQAGDFRYMETHGKAEKLNKAIARMSVEG